jgi:hypothetical protein
MQHRKLRIAWSVLWSIAFVLMAALWARSYQVLEFLRIPVTDSRGVFGMNFNGQTSVGFLTTIPQIGSIDRWSFDEVAPNTAVKLFGRFGAENRTLYLPSWFVVTTVGACAAAPWLRSCSKRFSLRALLIATTLICIGLELFVWEMR